MRLNSTSALSVVVSVSVETMVVLPPPKISVVLTVVVSSRVVVSESKVACLSYQK